MRGKPIESGQKNGASEGSRTLDNYLGKVALYQLSYARFLESAPFIAKAIHPVQLFFIFQLVTSRKYCFNLRMSFTPSVQEPETPTRPALWFIFRGNDLLVHSDTTHSPELPSGLVLPFPHLALIRRQFLGFQSEQPCFSAEVATTTPPPEGFEWVGLRGVFGRLPDELFWLAARAVQIMDWDRTHQFCSRCGHPAVARATERSKECPACGFLAFPRIAPAVIIRITRGREILLARSRHFAPGLFSVIAGFVEPGENLEQAAIREIKEEVGLDVCNLHYFASQPWPFPHSLMLAFTAEYAGGEIQVDPHELEEAHWFSLDQLPSLPGPLSISRRLIDDFYFPVAATGK